MSQINPQQWNSSELANWCPGCGDFLIQAALKQALNNQGLTPQDTLFTFDVGCSGNGADKIAGNTIHGLHGRTLPLAAGAKLGNHQKIVIASAGDGGTLSEGINHLIHAVRNDYPIIFLLHDNQNYGLTTGQASSTTPKGCTMNASPDGVLQDPINPLSLVLDLKPSSLSRTSSALMPHLVKTFENALQHRGFSFVQILQQCPTYNRHTDNNWYKDGVTDISELQNFDNTNSDEARKIINSSEPTYLGQLYRNNKKIDFLSATEHFNYEQKDFAHDVKNIDISSAIERL
jgi:2-oxoglutarate ferredoxin oxidoreductase subunit beta